MDTTEGNKDTYVKNVEVITQQQKWIPRKYETRRIKILHRGFRQIERLMHVSHVSVIDSLNKAAKELRRVEEEKKVEKEIEVIELDEMCIS